MNESAFFSSISTNGVHESGSIFANNKNCRIIDSRFVIYFSLPFYPAHKKNGFYNGHLALSVNGIVYQLYNPQLLRSNFFISVMPEKDWLCNDADFWVDGDPASQTFRHVHLYGRSELSRTAVYFIALKDPSDTIISMSEKYFSDLETAYELENVAFNLFTNNCAVVLNRLFYTFGFLTRGTFDFLPAVIFQRLLASLIKSNASFFSGKLVRPAGEFKRHRFCFGIPCMPAELHMDRLMKNYNGNVVQCV